MIVYDGIKSEFLNSVMNGTIAEEVRQRIFEKRVEQHQNLNLIHGRIH